MGMALHLNKLESPSTKDALTLVWLKLSCGSGEEDENVKNLRTGRLQMTGDQESSLELLAQVSKKNYW